jgi:hypothetical protein
MIRFACACGNELRADDEMAGRQVLCATCGQMQTVPAVTAEKPAAAREEIRQEPPRRRPESAEDDEGEYERPPERTSGKAAWSLGLGIASFLCTLFTGIPAVILGALALGDISRSRGRVGGQGLAIGGIVTGAIGMVLVLPVSIALLLPAVQKVRQAAGRTQSMNNLKQIGLAMHNYHDTYGGFPPAAGGPGMHPQLSWRVSVLPFLPDGQRLYKQFKLDEPWDSPNNKPLLEAMPKVYEMPGMGDPPGMTRYRVFVGEQSVFRPPFRGEKVARGVRLPEITDGTANTILAVEAADAVPWTKPDELDFAPGRPLPRLSDLYGGCDVLMCDGSVHLFPRDLPEANLRALITRSGNEIVTPP